MSVIARITVSISPFSISESSSLRVNLPGVEVLIRPLELSIEMVAVTTMSPILSIRHVVDQCARPMKNTRRGLGLEATPFDKCGSAEH
jgi:hypothetical protein